MKKVEKPAVAEIIREMIEANEGVLNEAMAEAIRERLGLSVSRADISRLRSEIGLNSYDVARQASERSILEEMRKVQHEFASAGVLNIPELALLEIVIRRREVKELKDKLDDLSGQIAKANRKS